MTMLALASNGSKKNIIRQETIQAIALSEKGIVQMAAQINSELEEFLGEGGQTRGEFSKKLVETLNEYKCPLDVINSVEDLKDLAMDASQTGDYGICIEDFSNVLDKNNKQNDLKKLVIFKSVGVSGDAKRLLTSKVEIGAQSVPETLKYAVGTNIMSSDPKNGEGNLLMHGGVEIQGDIKVDGNIVTKNKGVIVYNNIYTGNYSGEDWINSVFPTALPAPGSKSSKLVLGGKSFILNKDVTYPTHISKNVFLEPTYTYKTDINYLFEGTAPQVVSREPKKSIIGIDSKIGAAKFNRQDFGIETLQLKNDRTIKSKNMPYTNVFPVETIEKCKATFFGYCYGGWYTEYLGDSDFYIEGINSFNKMSTDGNLTIKQNGSSVFFGEGLYVQGNLIIGKNSENPNASQKSPDITLEGPIFVNGDVTIKEADLTSNALLYVNGKVNISHSTIKGKPLSNGSEGTLIIFASDNVKIHNISVRESEENKSKIKGFFYSEENMEIFGVESNIQIDGGISAKRIALNALRGGRTVYDRYGNITGFNFDSSENQKKKPSRLKIVYDPEIMSRFEELSPPEPIVHEVDPPLIKSRDVER